MRSNIRRDFHTSWLVHYRQPVQTSTSRSKFRTAWYNQIQRSAGRLPTQMHDLRPKETTLRHPKEISTQFWMTGETEKPSSGTTRGLQHQTSRVTSPTSTISSEGMCPPKIGKIIAQNVIEEHPPTEPAPWVSNAVIEPKPDGRSFGHHRSF